MSAKQVKATTFADPADIRAFRRCKARGKTDKQCFAVGDNGIGCWGDDTTQGKPMVALPPEDWKPLKVPRGAKVLLQNAHGSVTAELRDTMPARRNITNGAGIDLNPAAAEAMGIPVPGEGKLWWAFVEPVWR